MASKDKKPVLTEYDEDTGEWEIADEDDTMQDTIDEINDRIFGED
jgi:hypothetical protein